MAITATSGVIFGVKIGLEFEFCDGELSDLNPEFEDGKEFDEEDFEGEDLNQPKFVWAKTLKLAQNSGFDFESDGSSSSSNYIDGMYVGFNIKTEFRAKDIENIEKRFNELYTPEFQAALREIVGSDIVISEPGILSYYDANE